MSKAKLRWSATAVPRWRREYLRHLNGYRGQALRVAERMAQAAPEVQLQYGTAAKWETQAAVTSHRITQLQAAPLYWVTSDMARLALDASTDVPTFDRTAAPDTCGLMLFATALPPLSQDNLDGLALHGPTGLVTWTKPVPVDGVAWTTRDGVCSLDVLIRADRLPYPLDDARADLVAMMSLHAPWDSIEIDSLDELLPGQRALLALVVSAWQLMQIPTLAERKQLDTEWGGPVRPGTKPDRTVTLVDLRPLRHVATQPGETDSKGRVYRHRWIVRGHWTHQPYGPGQSLRKLIYREPYIKGPDGAPLHQTDKVMVWRR